MKNAARQRARRQQARRRGHLAETMCRWHLRLRGWRIVATDWRCPSGEIDIVARRGGVLAVVEVKSRGDIGSAANAV
jgi:putative endonuclease